MAKKVSTRSKNTNLKYCDHVLMCVGLTVDVDPDRFDGRGAQPILSFAVVAPALSSQDFRDVQRLVKNARVLEAVRHAARCLCPPDLKQDQYINKEC